MLNPKHSAYYDARNHYFEGIHYQREIAKLVGVSERTIYNWIKEGSWERLRQDAFLAPAVMIDNFISQLVEIQQNIASRDQGNRFPNPAEAEAQRKLLQCILKARDYPQEILYKLAASNAPVSDIIFNEPNEPEETRPSVPLHAQYQPYEPSSVKNTEKPENKVSANTQIIDIEKFSKNQAPEPVRKKEEKTGKKSEIDRNMSEAVQKRVENITAMINAVRQL